MTLIITIGTLRVKGIALYNDVNYRTSHLMVSIVKEFLCVHSFDIGFLYHLIGFLKSESTGLDKQKLSA